MPDRLVVFGFANMQVVFGLDLSDRLVVFGIDLSDGLVVLEMLFYPPWVTRRVYFCYPVIPDVCTCAYTHTHTHTHSFITHTHTRVCTHMHPQ